MRTTLIHFLSAMLLFAGGNALANDFTVGPITIDKPWSRATVAGIPNGVAYFSLSNAGTENDRLRSASSPVSERAELHTHIRDGEIMRMRQIEVIEVPAGGSTALEPGGAHVMLMGLKQPLEQGSTFPLTLVFDKAGSVTIDVHVDLMGGTGKADDHDEHHHH